MDKLEIKGLNVATRIGVHQWEQTITQRLILDISFSINAGDLNETLENTIDYDKLSFSVTEFIESQSFKLVETAALAVCQFIKAEFSLGQVTVCVSKPHAIKNAETVSITVTR